ncbi:nucleotide sugar dehydrogenase [Aduncisulcus paluster]|uniref:Nucleotide sugar dehydrogenase n=1 Tax=Aduncisulcus paluster TaxID=2918883 RepID=A0ABQ5KB38_9EUKA|nr:nucleotide sugar dehydrogenase [Aduncisulcus paluster]
MIMGKGNRKVGHRTAYRKGFELKLYDRNVNAAKLLGANRDYIMNRIPHISKLMVSDIESVLDFAETIVVGNNSPEFKDLQSKIRPGQVIVDLVRVDDSSLDNEHIDGICW